MSCLKTKREGSGGGERGGGDEISTKLMWACIMIQFDMHVNLYGFGGRRIYGVTLIDSQCLENYIYNKGIAFTAVHIINYFNGVVFVNRTTCT